MTPQTSNPLNTSVPPAGDKKKINETLEEVIAKAEEKWREWERLRRRPVKERRYGYGERDG